MIQSYQTLLMGALSQDECTEICYLILKERCNMLRSQTALASDTERLMRQPYSAVSNAFKELGSICYENYVLGQSEDMDHRKLEQLLCRINAAEMRLSSRIDSETTRMRYLTETAHLKTAIEVHLHCPLLKHVRLCIDATLARFELAAEQVNVLFITLHDPSEQSNKIQFGCIPKEQNSLSLLDEKVVQFWYETVRPSNVHFLFFVEIVTPDNHFTQLFNKTI